MTETKREHRNFLKRQVSGKTSFQKVVLQHSESKEAANSFRLNIHKGEAVSFIVDWQLPGQKKQDIE